MATIAPVFKFQFLDGNGNPLTAGKLYTYIAGTTTPLTTYTTAAGSTPNTNPIILDSAGRADIFLTAGSAYKFVLANAGNVTQYTVDNITAPGTMSTQNASAVTITGGTISGVTITGPITGDVTGNLTGNVTGNLTGNVTGGAIVGASYNGGQLAGLRNKIINGAVLVNQRRQVGFVGTTGSSVSTKSNSLQCPDRWSFVSSTTAVMSVYQDADGPSSALNLNTCLKFLVTTADASPAATEYFSAVQTIEGRELSSLVNKTFTVSFWVKSSVIGVYSLALWSEPWGSGLSKSYVAEYSISAANTWEYKTVTVINGLPSTTQWYLTDSVVGLTVGWALYSGSTYSTSATGAWNNASFLAATSQVNAVATNGNVFAITGMQLETGSVATPFEHRAFGLEYGLCLRYYEKSFSYGTTAAQNTATTDGAAYGVAAFGNQAFGANVRFAAPKPLNPTITTYAPDATSANWSTNITTPTATAVNIGTNGFAIRGSTSTTAGNAYSIHWDANAEL
jgi:hypothetical protein